jgi:hypothetical protein
MKFAEPVQVTEDNSEYARDLIEGQLSGNSLESAQPLVG